MTQEQYEKAWYGLLGAEVGFNEYVEALDDTDVGFNIDDPLDNPHYPHYGDLEQMKGLLDTKARELGLKVKSIL